MKLIIDIHEKDYNSVKNGHIPFCIISIFENAIPIPDNATNERMVGKWIKSRDCYGNYHFTCSECGNEITTKYADNWEDKYCSECGARMKGVENEKGYIL